MNDYHSFSSTEGEYSPHWTFNVSGHIGQVFDIAMFKGQVPAPWWLSDVIYSEISWRVGYSVFTGRAGSTDTKFTDYISGIRQIIKLMRLPVFLIGSVMDMKALKADAIIKMRFKTPARNDVAYCGVWNDPGCDMKFDSHIEVLKYIKTRHKTVLDFSCGYLSIADVLLPECRLICSDINPKCIGAAKAKLEAYYGTTNKTN